MEVLWEDEAQEWYLVYFEEYSFLEEGAVCLEPQVYSRYLLFLEMELSKMMCQNVMEWIEWQELWMRSVSLVTEWLVDSSHCEKNQNNFSHHHPR